MSEIEKNVPSLSGKQGIQVGEAGRFLIFEVGDTLYGTPLLSVREVIEEQVTKPVPFAPRYFVGIMNLRGRVISVIDLRKKFKIESEKESAKSFIMVLDLDETAIGVMIDRIVSVQSLTVDDVSYLPTVDTHIDPDYLYYTKGPEV